jgi:Domain of unknown function (DUF932)
MARLASRFGAVNLVRRDRPLTRDELAHHVPSVFSEEKHESRSDRYTYIPTITLLDNLQREGFLPFFACQTRVRDQSKREHTKHMLRLRRYQRIQENLIKGGLSGRTTKGKRAHTRAVKGIGGDVKLNRALWVMAENMLQFAS